MKLPDDVKFILDKLNNKYEAYVVGGCVRDYLMGLEPNDYDITTSATPDEVKEVFSNYNFVNDNGLKHGTVTLRLNKENYEITTFRIEAEYLDCRRPSDVSFTRSIEEDLKRRDFTINAIAYNKNGYKDFYNGVKDIENKVIKAVLNPQDRFNEDALRILRCLRFSSKLNFSIEESTNKAMYECMNNILNISIERVKVELEGILLGVNSFNVLNEHRDIISLIIPELKDMFNFNQNNKYHQNDVYIHSLKVVENCCNNRILKVVALLHDIGKPHCYTEDFKSGVLQGHFYGHADISVEISKKILKRLKFSNEDTNKILVLIKYHDYQLIPTNKSIKKFLNKLDKYDLDFKIIDDLIEIQKSDMSDHLLRDEDKYNSKINEVKKIIHYIVNNECFNLNTLCIKGDTLISLGYSGKEIGIILNDVLENVINNRLSNNKDEIIKYINKKHKIN